jgi:hypothetical protein
MNMERLSCYKADGRWPPYQIWLTQCLDGKSTFCRHRSFPWLVCLYMRVIFTAKSHAGRTFGILEDGKDIRRGTLVWALLQWMVAGIPGLCRDGHKVQQTLKWKMEEYFHKCFLSKMMYNRDRYERSFLDESCQLGPIYTYIYYHCYFFKWEEKDDDGDQLLLLSVTFKIPPCDFRNTLINYNNMSSSNDNCCIVFHKQKVQYEYNCIAHKKCNSRTDWLCIVYYEVC